jgi:hypothetical protein
MFKNLEIRKFRKNVTILLLDCCDVENHLLKPRSLSHWQKYPVFPVPVLPHNVAPTIFVTFHKHSWGQAQKSTNDPLYPKQSDRDYGKTTL